VHLTLHILLVMWITMACLLHVFAMMYPRLVLHQPRKNAAQTVSTEFVQSGRVADTRTF
jgi:hypothetical protein